MTLRLIVAAAVLAALTGCVQSRQVQLLGPAVRTTGDGSGVPGLAFGTNIDTRDLVSQQLLLEVRLLDNRWRPVMARTPSYRNSAGAIAAGKSLMVLKSPWTFENVVVTLPGPELKAVEADRPAWAEFRVLTPDSKVLASQRVKLPADYMAQLPAATATPAAAAAPPPHSGAPLAAAPPESGSAAAASGDAAGDSPPPRPSARANRSSPTGREAARADSLSRRTSPTARSSRGAPRSREAAARIAQRRTAPRGESPSPAATEDRRTGGDVPATGGDAAGTSGETLPTPAPAVPPTQPPPAERRELPAPEPAPPTDRPATPSPDPPAEPPPAKIDEPAPPPKGDGPTLPPGVREYTVRNGDTLIGIAKRELRDPTRWYDIFDLNRDLLSSPDELKPGMIIRLPPAASE